VQSTQREMEEQLTLIEDALKRARLAKLGGMPLDIAVARQYGDSTVTLRTQLPAKEVSAKAPTVGGLQNLPAQAPARAQEGVDRGYSTVSLFEADAQPQKAAPRMTSAGSFYDEGSEVSSLLNEIERLKRKALSRGVNLTSPQEDVPAEDVTMLKQIFSLADQSGDGFLEMEEISNLHYVLGEPLSEAEAVTAFKAMDRTGAGRISFDDFIAWYTLAHSSSGMLSKKGIAYTQRFKKIMAKVEGAFDIKNLTTMSVGQPKSLEYRVQFHYNDRGQLKQISPWHDIPLYTTDGHLHFITEIPKFSRAKFEIATGEALNPIKQDVKNGKLRNYNWGDMLFNYGAFPQTWEDPSHVTPDTGYGGDNDPIDGVEIGTRMMRTGACTKVKVLGVLAMVDDGETDWKVVCINVDDPLSSKLNDIEDVEREMPGAVSCLREWLRVYKTVDGKPENSFGLEGKAMGREYTLGVIQETHDFWKKLTASGSRTV